MKTKVLPLLVVMLSFSGSVSAQAADPPHTPSKDDGSVYFISHVMPLITKLGCNQTKCHGSLKGKSDFKLSMFGAEPAADYAALTKSAEGRRVNKVEPLKSLFLLKATASIPHKGKQRLQVGSPKYNTLAAWVAQGTPWAAETQPALVSVDVLPQEQILQKGKTGQISATATFADGTKKDVTRVAVYKSLEERVAVVDENGTITAADSGESAIVVTYMRRSAVTRAVVPQVLPAPFPQVAAKNKIDELVYAKLKKLGIPPSERCSDHVFVRRVFLDAIGTLPTPDEARAFLSDSDPQKRSKLIERLLDREEFVDFWALKWSDLLRIKTGVGVVRPAAGKRYYEWVRESIAQNKPYDQFARELITASGSNYRYGATNFFMPVSNKDPQSFAEAAALIFMGARIGCARCHGDPRENWGLDDNLGLAAFFAQVKFKPTREWTEEIVYVSPKQVLRHPKTGEVVQPKFLDGAVVDLAALENAAKEAETAAANAKAAAAQAAAAQAAAAQAALAKRQQATKAKKKVDDLVQKQQKPAETKLAAAAKAAADATTAKAAADKVLADAQAATTKAQQADDAAEKAAKDAEAKSKAVSRDAAKSEEEKKKAAAEATAKRKAADATKTALTQAKKTQQQAQNNANTAAQNLTNAETRKKSAEQALTNVKNQVAAADKVGQAAEKAAKDAEAAAAKAKVEADKAPAVQLAAEKQAAAKRKLADEKNTADHRVEFAQWLTSPENPWFARNIVNRIWYWLLGRGIVHEADDLRLTNPPENPELLQYLATELVNHKYDLKHIYRLILNSETYQRSSLPNRWNEKDRTHFSHYRVKRLGAEQLLDAVSEITETWERFVDRVAAPNVTLPSGYQAKQIPDGSIESPFLKLFGRAPRDTSFESQRTSTPSMPQALYLINSDQFQAKVVNSPRIKRLIQEKKSDAEVIDELYFVTLSRAPTQKQKKRVLEYVLAKSKPILDQAHAEKKVADEALAKVQGELAKAKTDYEAAQKAAQAAEGAAKAVSGNASKSADEKKKAADEAAAKRKAANEAKTKRDKLAGDEKAANTKVTEANKKVDAANAEHQKFRLPALQDVLWTLLNTKEFMFNH